MRHTVEGAMLKHKMADLCSRAVLLGASKLRLRLGTKDGPSARSIVPHSDHVTLSNETTFPPDS